MSQDNTLNVAIVVLDALKAMHCVENKREMDDLMKSSRPVIKRVEALFCTKDSSRAKESRTCTMWELTKRSARIILICIIYV